MSIDEIPSILKLSSEWRITEEISQGGFGKVYGAVGVKRNRAAVKIVLKAPGAHRELLFEELDGVPNIVPILDRGEWGDYWVLVMPRGDRSLRDYLDETGGKLPVAEAISLLSDIAAALTGIEGKVVHRDIKPENILQLEGKWCLADFGIARYLEATTAADTRKFAMSERYAAPEQWRAERAVSATDVYAFGAVAYELLQGQPPFPGPDYREQHLNNFPPPLKDCPPWLESLVVECLSKVSGSRPTATNLANRLKEDSNPSSGAARRLQEVNSTVVRAREETLRKEVIAQAKEEEKLELFTAANHSLVEIASKLNQEVKRNASAAISPSPGHSWSWTLGQTQLSIDLPQEASSQQESILYRANFSVIAYARIRLTVNTPNSAYKGRSHSLWYCDAQEAGVFRWYETAFITSGLSKAPRTTEPFDLPPDRDAFLAHSNVMHTINVAWPFVAIDQGDEAEFFDRWIGWFADGVQGQLRRP